MLKLVYFRGYLAVFILVFFFKKYFPNINYFLGFDGFFYGVLFFYLIFWGFCQEKKIKITYFKGFFYSLVALISFRCLFLEDNNKFELIFAVFAILYSFFYGFFQDIIENNRSGTE